MPAALGFKTSFFEKTDRRKEDLPVERERRRDSRGLFTFSIKETRRRNSRRLYEMKPSRKSSFETFAFELRELRVKKMILISTSSSF